jgi:hypothetical protein
MIYMIKKDKNILKDLAKKTAEIANLPEQKEKADMWARHNRLERVKPMVLIFPEGAWREMLDEKDLITTGKLHRRYELDLRRRLYYWEHMKDDNVIEANIACPIVIHDTEWGIGDTSIRPEELAGAKHFDAVIKTESDIDKIQIPQVTIDWKATEENFQKTVELFGDILTVEKRGPAHFWVSIMDDFAVFRGFDQMFLDMVDRPEWLHKVLNKMTEGWLERLDVLEKQNALSLNNRNHYVGSGGVGYTAQLPKADFDGTRVRPIDMWGHATTQIFSEVSPAMHDEFALQYEKRILERFGLNCYGCCEPLHKKLDLVKTIPNLRRVSMSPWVNVEEGAAALEDKYIFSYKPNPAVIAAETWNPKSVYTMLREIFEKTKGCIVEIIMKDTHTCRNQPHRMWEWVKIAKETAGEFIN